MKNGSRWRDEALPSIAPRLITDTQQSNAPATVRVYSGAAGEGGIASLKFLSISVGPAPISFVRRSQEKLHELSPSANKICISELYATVGATFLRRA